ncbi:MAG: hypothetical protein ACR2LM_00595 [Pyrinomonadaceae bacterium]
MVPLKDNSTLAEGRSSFLKSSNFLPKQRYTFNYEADYWLQFCPTEEDSGAQDFRTQIPQARRDAVFECLFF